ncbi:hypothetical protein BX281_2766 [Streptomyces sp. Ag82_O1-15]|nr:hypothetical protein BX281_2766 [Streptomyces sp. Ag82_O1-15]
MGVGAERAARVDDHLLQPVGPFAHGCQAPAQEARPHIGVGGAERHEDAGTRVVESVLGVVFKCHAHIRSEARVTAAW